MICTFFGHHDAPSSIRGALIEEIENLIGEGVREFYVGNNGEFDLMVQLALDEISRKSQGIRYSIILSRIDESSIAGLQWATLFPEGLERAIPKFAISKRNEWLLKNAQIVVTYMRHKSSNCYKWVEKARSRGLRIINVGK